MRRRDSVPLHLSRNPISVAPREEQRRLLLFCPVEGWIAGEWFEGRWVDALTLKHELRPTWWMEVPEEPEGTAEVMLERMMQCRIENRGWS